jgi:hypothetical protein
MKLMRKLYLLKVAESDYIDAMKRVEHYESIQANPLHLANAYRDAYTALEAIQSLSNTDSKGIRQ